MKRREFLQTSAASVLLSGAFSLPGLTKSQEQPIDLAVVQNGEPGALVRKAVETLGGMKQFVSNQDIVVIKPNMSWDRVPEQAATTNPEIVAEVVKMCFESGAKAVRIFDNTLNEARRCYKRSGIQKAAEDAGAEVSFINPVKFKNIKIENGEIVKNWEVYTDAIEADVLINLPIAKHHSVSGVSLGMKNMMGLIGGRRGALHRQYDTKINDVNSLFKTRLTILDAYRILLRNGPSGGNVSDVALKKIVIAGTDRVAVDAYGVTLFDLKPADIGFLNEANARGMGRFDLDRLNVQVTQLAS